MAAADKLPGRRHADPVGPAGAAGADREACVDGERRRLHDVIAHPGITILLHRDAALPGEIDLDPLVTVHRLTDVPGTDLIAVRPDGHVGYRCDEVDVSQLLS